MSGDRPVVLLTGAAGRVGGRLRPYLHEHYRLRLTDRTSVERVPRSEAASIAGRATDDEPIIVGDLLDEDFVDQVVAGVSTIVHLAGNPKPQATWAEVAVANVDMTELLLAAAARHRIRRFVYGSSIHAAGQYLRDDEVPIDPASPPAPCCHYGVSKVAAEALCRLYATRYGLSAANLRIAMAAAAPDPNDPFSLEAWVSPGDLAGLVLAALEGGLDYGTYFAVSANARSKWSIANARRDLGFTAHDDAEEYAHLVDMDAPARPACFRRP